MTDLTVLGVDIGGTKIRVTLQDAVGRVVKAAQVQTPTEGGAAVVDAVVVAIEGMDGPTAGMCGVGTPGSVDH